MATREAVTALSPIVAYPSSPEHQSPLPQLQASSNSADSSFASRVLAWYDRHGRHELPWQHPRTPYRVWLSEVMLQQTQVATVIPYFSRFVAALPTLDALAAAPGDQVLALWSGLGYYSRARNLHRAAKICVESHGGELPNTIDLLRELPGVGRSTAGAILSLALGGRAPILDGNVRCVLIRHRGIEGDPLSPAIQRRLWALSAKLLPQARVADYTQAIMDVGATVCVRARPLCMQCPLRDDCTAFATSRTTQLPTPRRRPARSRRDCFVLVVRDAAGRILLERRPTSGVWGGLWSLPEFADPSALAASLSRWAVPTADKRTTACSAAPVESRNPYSLRRFPPIDLSAITHTFTHFDLTMRPTLLDLGTEMSTVSELDSPRFFATHELVSIGLPAPIRQLLARLPEPFHAA